MHRFSFSLTHKLNYNSFGPHSVCEWFDDRSEFKHPELMYIIVFNPKLKKVCIFNGALFISIFTNYDCLWEPLPVQSVAITYCEFESRSWRGVLDTTLCDKVCLSLATGRRFRPPIKLTATL